jgi:cell division control protein 6
MSGINKDILMWDETLFRDPEVFEIDYVPEQFNFRETQMRELAFQIKPGMKGGRPLNTVCRGLPGTGKTTSIRKLFGEIEDTTKKLVPIHVNCQIDNTKFAVFSQIYRKLSGHLPPSSGTSFKQVFDAIARILQKEEQVLLVALDDANYLLYENELNRVLYILLRSHEAYPGTRIGVIVIISDMDVDLSRVLDARVSSVFRPTEIYFPPYTYEEVRTIIGERVQQGLYMGCLSPELFELVVEQTQKSGDLRVGIDLLKRAGLNAEKRASRKIEREDICGAYKVSRYLHLASSVKSLKPEERTVLGIIARHAEKGGEMNAGDVYQVVRQETELGYTRFYEIIRKLDAMRLLNLEYRDGKGRTRMITLRYNPVKICEYIS